MTWEQQHKCSYHPHCALHLGHRPESFTDDDIREIRQRYRDEQLIAEIATGMCLPWATVANIVYRKSFKDVPDESVRIPS